MRSVLASCLLHGLLVGTALVFWHQGRSMKPTIDFDLAYVHEADVVLAAEREEELPREEVRPSKEVPLQEPDFPEVEEPPNPLVEPQEYLPLEKTRPIPPEVWFQIVVVKEENDPEPENEEEKPAAARPVPPAAKPTPVIGENPPPEYPRRAIRLAIEGRVLIEVAVDAQGKVTGCKVVRSSGHAILDRAALKAVRSWRFLNGPGVVCVPVSFVLRRH